MPCGHLTSRVADDKWELQIRGGCRWCSLDAPVIQNRRCPGGGVVDPREAQTILRAANMAMTEIR